RKIEIGVPSSGGAPLRLESDRKVA
ncbi:hypothetical protein GGE33_005591, partial [Rhizobium cellulosilyticum]|nr:hypothetical protein [Rhizobium cellulosilyticum]